MQNLGIAYAEVYQILNLLEEEELNKIPITVREFLAREKEQEYEKIIECDKPLKQQKLQRETYVLLAALDLKYWRETEEEKKELIEMLIYNDKQQ